LLQGIIRDTTCCRTLERDSALRNSFLCTNHITAFFCDLTLCTLCCYGIIRGMMCCKTTERGSALQDPLLGTVHITASMTRIFRTLTFHGIIKLRCAAERDSALRNALMGTNYITASFYNVYIPTMYVFTVNISPTQKSRNPTMCTEQAIKKVRIKHAYCNIVY
jgi:hypothetical protein